VAEARQGRGARISDGVISEQVRRPLHRRLKLLELDDPRWRHFVDSRADALPFHDPGWANLLARCYGFRSWVVALENDVRQIDCGIPMLEVGSPLRARRWVALPFTDFSPVLGRSQEELLSALLDDVRRWGVEAIEIHAPFSARPGVHPRLAGFRHVLPLSADVDAVLQGMSSMHRRNIRKAQRLGMSIARASTTEAVDVFYRLHVQTRRRLGVPVQPRRFFRLLGDWLQEHGVGFVLTAMLHGTPIASAVFLTRRDTLVYKYGASDARFWEHRPNNLLFWSAISWACENGYRTLDWGRTDPEDVGLRAFKSGWGAQEQPLHYSVLSVRPPTAVQRRNNRYLKILIRRSPVWVCEVLGALLYRYAA
jgi:CelD/BcsL family acetyltransferase involved in cellulose biosynthesis